MPCRNYIGPASAPGPGFRALWQPGFFSPMFTSATYAGKEELTWPYLWVLHSSAKWAAHSRAERRRCSAWCQSQEHCIMQINTPIFFRIFLSS